MTAVERRHRELAVACVWAAGDITSWERGWVETGEGGRWTNAEQLIRTAQALADIEAAAKPKWIACAEKMPDDRCTVLLFPAVGVYPVIGFWAFTDGWRELREGLGIRRDDITHWQPLPALPSPPEAT